MDRRLARMIDHTFLGAAGDAESVRRLCREAKRCGFAAVCVNPAEVPLAARLLKSSRVAVATVVGFPLGQNTTRIKCAEALDAIESGARELDFVVNERLLKFDPQACFAELKALIAAVRSSPRPQTVTKLILECCNLTPAEMIRGARLAKRAGFDFVKTSTGFGAHGATVADVRRLRRAVGAQMGVKAAGGIRDRESALALVAAGADRLGTSAGPKLVR